VTASSTLPSVKRAREGFDPLAARVVLAGQPGVGKTTLAASWAPDTTLIIDTHGGTSLLAGEHYVVNVDSFRKFTEVIDSLAREDHQFKTVVIDLIGDIYKFADQQVAVEQQVTTAALVGYGKGVAEAEALFRKQVDRLLSSPLGIWFLTHTDVTEDEKTKERRYLPLIDKRIRPYIEGACQFMWLAEALTPSKRVLHTEPSIKFQAKSRVPIPDAGPLDAAQLYKAIADATKPDDTIFDPNTEE
jgi:hypothetical protein